MEAVVGRARATRHPWLVARVANVIPQFFFTEQLVVERNLHVHRSVRSGNFYLPIHRPEKAS